jgi:hypothetical protein
VYDKASGEAVALSAEDGKRLHAVKLPDNIGGIAWSKDCLLATRAEPEAVLFIDAEDGTIKREVTGKVWGEFSAWRGQLACRGQGSGQPGLNCSHDAHTVYATPLGRDGCGS